ncbi:unnamed protein product [Ilex paraguariensis]|uniref:Protein kinase domain-containing protein n=1 Tax=Ilex paraguariensis TaxID=185542 RepID=A0ABC8RKD5_9AQUA
MNSPLFFTTTVIFSLVFSLPTSFSDLATDRAALLALRSVVGGRALLWNLSEPTPCSWSGITCSSNPPIVTELRLPGMGLSGAIPMNTVGNLTHLRILSLRFNSLSGPLPSDISSLSELRNLYLQENAFSGPIPASLSVLTNVVRLDLANNNFSGSIPSSLNNLTRLSTLYLQNNNLTGPIPDLNSSSLVLLNVSNNQLTGPIPSRFSRMPTSAFQGNSLCGGPLLSCDGTGSGGGKKLSGGAIAGIVIGSVLGFLLIVVILVLLCRKKWSKEVGSKGKVAMKKGDPEMPRKKSIESGDRDSSSSGFPAVAVTKGKGGGNGGGEGKNLVFFGESVRTFDLEDLLRASAEVLGKGTFGTAYKVVLEVGTVLAVKRLKDVGVPEKEFREKIEVVGKMDHENLVALRAYYYNRNENLLVFDYLPVGSLSSLLHEIDANAYFTAATMIIAVPTNIKIIRWTTTMWG